MYSRCLFFLVLFLSPFSLLAKTTLPTTTFTLNNGLQIIVREDHRAPVVMSQVWYKVGSMDEPHGITGISHVLEHMMFKGTRAHPDGSYAKIIGANGGSQNAMTSYDFTAYYVMAAKTKLPIIFELEADRMQHLQLKLSDFEKEIEVVKEERRLRVDDKPSAVTYERFAASAFVANPYRHPIIGWMSDLNQMTVKDLKKWYKTWYRPNNATLVVVGDVEPQQVFKMAKRHFSRIPAAQLPKRKRFIDILPIGERHVNVKAPAKVPILMRGYNVPVLVDATDEKPYALLLLAAALGGSESAILPKELVREKQIAAEVSTSYDAISRAPTVFFFVGVPSGKHTIADIQKAFNEKIASLKEQPMDNARLERVKTQFKAQYIFAKDSLYRQAIELGNLQMVGLPWQAADQMLMHIDKVTAQDIQKVAQEFLIPNKMTEAILHPQPIKAGVS